SISFTLPLALITSCVARHVRRPAWVLTSLVCRVQSIMVPCVSRKLRSPSWPATDGESSSGRSLSAKGPASLYGPSLPLAWSAVVLLWSVPPACRGLPSRRWATSLTGVGALGIG